jgi:hypothetical protein
VASATTRPFPWSSNGLSDAQTMDVESMRASDHLDRDSVFPSLVERIEDAYERLGHRLGWRFLYTPESTLSRETRLALVAANPGGKVYRPPMPSSEEGNAYRLERWGKGGTLKPLQVQVRRLFEELGRRLDVGSPERLMDETLTGNFCPFRSPSWADLHNKRPSIRFSEDLWHSILERVEPRAVICLGGDAARQIKGGLERHQWTPVGRPEQCSVGWGAVTYEVSRYESARGQTLIARLPHLSTFQIFSREKCRPAIERLTVAIAAAVGDQP